MSDTTVESMREEIAHRCEGCYRVIKVMIFQGSGFCSDFCRKRVTERRRLAAERIEAFRVAGR